MLFSADGSAARCQRGLSNPRSVAFDADGRLYVGDEIGLIHVLVPDADAEGVYRVVGAGLSGLDEAIVDLAWDRTYGLLAVIREEETGLLRQRLWRINPSAACAKEGRLITTPLDSKIERCQWHRIALKAVVPEAASIEIECFTADVLAPRDANIESQLNALNKKVSDPKFSQWTACTLSGDTDPDCLVQCKPGRFLWLRLTFRSDGLRSPSLHWIKVYFPRASYLQYLPAIYQEDEESRLFLERFLSIFQTAFDHLDQRIDLLWQMFDPASIEAKHLHWLAGWLALTINPEWPEAKLRDMIKKTTTAYRLRGTKAGLEQAVKDYTGVEFVGLIEHYRLQQWTVLSVIDKGSPEKTIKTSLDGTARLWSRNFDQRLQLETYSQLGYFRLTGTPEPALDSLAEGAHRFSVFFPADPYDPEEKKREVAAVVERERPSHTEATLCPVFPRFRVGIQASIGVDSVVGGITHLVLSKVATLNYDTILACSAAERQMHTLGTLPRPRVGVSTRIA